MHSGEIHFEIALPEGLTLRISGSLPVDFEIAFPDKHQSHLNFHHVPGGLPVITHDDKLSEKETPKTDRQYGSLGVAVAGGTVKSERGADVPFPPLLHRQQYRAARNPAGLNRHWLITRAEPRRDLCVDLSQAHDPGAKPLKLTVADAPPMVTTGLAMVISAPVPASPSFPLGDTAPRLVQ